MKELEIWLEVQSWELMLESSLFGFCAIFWLDREFKLELCIKEISYKLLRIIFLSKLDFVVSYPLHVEYKESFFGEEKNLQIQLTAGKTVLVICGLLRMTGLRLFTELTFNEWMCDAGFFSSRLKSYVTLW